MTLFNVVHCNIRSNYVRLYIAIDNIMFLKLPAKSTSL